MDDRYDCEGQPFADRELGGLRGPSDQERGSDYSAEGEESHGVR